MKGPAGLGIMIIEGKHAEIGSGIFVSDIQNNSVADMVTQTHPSSFFIIIILLYLFIYFYFFFF